MTPTAWHRFPESSKKPSGEAGASLKFIPQSTKETDPRMENTMVFMSSIGRDFRVIAFVRCNREALM
jgi:hypothetical protein